MSENDDEVPIECDDMVCEDSDSGENALPKSAILKTLMKNQNEVLNNQQKLLEKFKSMENKLDKLEKQMNPISEPTENNTETVDNKPDEQEPQQPILPQVSKQFVLKHTFKNVSIDLTRKDGPFEEFFGVEWAQSIQENSGTFGSFLQLKNSGKGDWSITTDFDLKVIHPNGKALSKSFSAVYGRNVGYGHSELLNWEELKKDYLVDDELRVEAHVRITEMTGIYKDNLRCFDDPDCSDIVLIVQDKKFYVSKLYLAAHSSYFKAMFLGMFGDAKKSEIPLTGIDAADFQKYLEVLYGENAIDETILEGMLLLADMYETPIVIQKCEKFLLEKSKKTIKKKLQMAARYNFEKLKKKCLSEIKTVDDIRSVSTDDIQDMDPSLVALLFKKSLSLR